VDAVALRDIEAFIMGADLQLFFDAAFVDEAVPGDSGVDIRDVFEDG